MSQQHRVWMSAGQYTEFTFDAPICLLPGQEYAIVLLSNSNQYNVYAAAVGDKILGDDLVISQPPYLGVLFKSQNATTWTPYQGESLMFRVNKAVFTTNTPMFVTFNNPSALPSANGLPLEYYMDLMYLTNQDQVLTDTTLQYAYRAMANNTRTLDSTYTSVIPAQNFYFGTREVVELSGNSFYLQATGQSSLSDMSPIIDAERYSILAIEEQINNGGFGNSDITISNPGEGYNIANTNVITVTGGNGSGAQLEIGSVDANGNITSIIVTPGGSGQSYTGQANVAIVASGYTPTITASVNLASELHSSGGNFVARYITRMVTLAPGMAAGDLNVIFDACKPSGSQIYVYYKILSAEDPTPFSARPYSLMSLVGTDSFATTPATFISYNYVGTLDQYGNPIRNISYGSYPTFQYFAIKIVMATNNPTLIPIIQNFTATAMPGAS